MNTLDLGVRMIAIKRDNFGWMEGVCLIARKYLPETRKMFELVPTWKEVPEGQMIDYANDIILRPEQAQELMDSLWQCGLRPVQGSGSAGSLAATEEHLKTVKEYLDRMTRLVENPLYMVRNIEKGEK